MYIHKMSCLYTTCHVCRVCTTHVVYVQHVEYVHNMSRRSCMYNTYCMYNKACMCTACCTGWQRLKGCLICTGHFSKRALLLVVNLRRLTFDLRHPVSLQVIFRKRALSVVANLRRAPYQLRHRVTYQLRHPLRLRHPVLEYMWGGLG